TLSPEGGSIRQDGLLGLLDPVGEYFSESVIDAPFNPDPPGSFFVDSKVTPDDVKALGLALNAGAIVLIPPTEGEVVLGEIRGHRFRLSYLMAPHYKLPLRIGRGVS